LIASLKFGEFSETRISANARYILCFYFISLYIYLFWLACAKVINFAYMILLWCIYLCGNIKKLCPGDAEHSLYWNENKISAM